MVYTKEMEIRLPFSRWWITAIITILWGVLLYLVIPLIPLKNNNGDFVSLSVKEIFDFKKVNSYWNNLDNLVPHFSAVMFLSVLFLIVSWVSISIYISLLPSYLKDLEPIFQLTNNASALDINKELISENKAYLSLLNNLGQDLNKKNWLIYSLIIGVIAVPVHYIFWGSFVKEKLGFYVLLAVIILTVIPIIFLGSWLAWLLFSQYFHLYKFTVINENSKSTLYIGQDINQLEKSSSFFDRAIYFLGKKMKLLPTETHPLKIKIDIFNVDNLGGLSSLANMSLLGTLLTSIVFAISVPLLILASIKATIFLLPLFLLAILTIYYIGISSIREAIKTEKFQQLQLINAKLSVLAEKIVTAKIDEDTEQLKSLMSKFKLFEEIGIKIKSVPETPKTIGAILKLATSGGLPIISFGSITQSNLLSLIFH